ncbi:unnamed protein product [Lactuca saligna]|uniref:Uncharacterized protein n=1 Tax=Lactuca saligna TaxID=75948 RepID=A0AA35VJ97_LACSI|nr:unnamed protein product [Lactuca saligna]
MFTVMDEVLAAAHQLKSRDSEALYEPSLKGCNVEPGCIYYHVSVIGSLQYENSDHVLSPTWSTRVFSPSGVPDIQWRPESSFQTQHEYTCTLNSNKYNNNEAAPFLECHLFLEELISNFQHSKTLFYNSSSGWGGAPPASPNTATSAQQQNLIQLQSSQQMSTSSKDSANNNSKVDDIEQQQQQIHQQSVTSDDSIPDPAQSPILNKNTSNEEDSNVSYALDMQQGFGTITEAAQSTRDVDLSPGQPLQSNQSVSLGVIGRRILTWVQLETTLVDDLLMGRSSVDSTSGFQDDPQERWHIEFQPWNS